MKALEDTLELGDKSSGDTTLAGIINDYANGRGLKSRSILDGITYDRLTRSDIDWLIKQTEENNKKLKASLTGLKKFFQDHWKIGELA